MEKSIRILISKRGISRDFHQPFRDLKKYEVEALACLSLVLTTADMIKVNKVTHRCKNTNISTKILNYTRLYHNFVNCTVFCGIVLNFTSRGVMYQNGTIALRLASVILRSLEMIISFKKCYPCLLCEQVKWAFSHPNKRPRCERISILLSM